MDLSSFDTKYSVFKMLFKDLESSLIALDVTLKSADYSDENEVFKSAMDRLKQDTEEALSSLIQSLSLSKIASLCTNDTIIKFIDSFQSYTTSRLAEKDRDRFKDLQFLPITFNRVFNVLTQIKSVTNNFEDIYISRLRDDFDREFKANESFKKYEKDLNASFDDLKKLKEVLVRSDEKISNVNDKLNQKTDAFEREFDRLLEILNGKIAEVDVLIGLASNKVISHDFANSARDEKELADKFRVASIVLILLVTSLFSVVLIETSNFGFEIENSVFKILMGLLLSVPAAYFARESNKHRSRQHSLHQVSLELNTISPFLKDLPEEDQIKVKSNFANKLFGSSSQEKIESDVIPSNVIELISEIVKKTTQK